MNMFSIDAEDQIQGTYSYVGAKGHMMGDCFIHRVTGVVTVPGIEWIKAMVESGEDTPENLPTFVLAQGSHQDTTEIVVLKDQHLNLQRIETEDGFFFKIEDVHHLNFILSGAKPN